MMDFDDDLNFAENDLNLSHECKQEIFDLPILDFTPPLTRRKSQMRPIDLPSMKKHYGMMTFFDHHFPIIYRLIDDTVYIPYIRLSYVFNIFERPPYSTSLVNIQNLPVVEMTSAERIYCDQLSSSTDPLDWSNYQLLSVAILDSIVAIIDLTHDFNHKNDPPGVERCKEWREALNALRQEARNRWVIDEKTILSRLSHQNSGTDTLCIASTNMAKRRSFFEQRLDLSFVDEAGGFIQIDSFIYPFVKCPSNDQIYLHLGDVRHRYFPPLSHLIVQSTRDSSMHRAYGIVSEQAQTNYQWNLIRHGRNSDLSKVLPCSKMKEERLIDELQFIALHVLLHLISINDSNSNLPFVQLFETASLNEIERDYKTNVGRQFVMEPMRQGGVINDHIPCLIHSQLHHQTISISSETKTCRTMNNDERLFLNMISLHKGFRKKILTKKTQWYLTEIIDNDEENINIEFFNTQRRRRGRE